MNTVHAPTGFVLPLAPAVRPATALQVHSARNTQRVPFFVIPGKAVGRDPESTPSPLDSGLRRNDGLLRVSGTVKSLRRNPLRNYGAVLRWCSPTPATTD